MCVCVLLATDDGELLFITIPFHCATSTDGAKVTVSLASEGDRAALQQLGDALERDTLRTSRMWRRLAEREEGERQGSAKRARR